MPGNKGKLVIARGSNDSFILRLSDRIDPTTPISEVFDEIKITLGDICPSQVKLLIEADKSISIIRTELE